MLVYVPPYAEYYVSPVGSKYSVIDCITSYPVIYLVSLCMNPI